MFSGSSDRIAGNSRKHQLSSDIEDDQPVTLRRRKQSYASEPHGLNSESDDNQLATLRRRKQPLALESDDDKPYVVCL